MPLPLKRGLPPINELSEAEEPLITLTDEDFNEKDSPPEYQDTFVNTPNSATPKSEPVKEVLVEPVLEPIIPTEEEPIKTEKKPKRLFSLRFGEKKKAPKESSISKKKITSKTKNIIAIIVSLLFLVIAFVVVSVLVKGKLNTSATEGKNTQSTTAIKGISIKYDREESNGIVFLIKSDKEAVINVQRLYEESDGTMVLCETGDIDIMEGEQEGFLTCQNPTEKVENTNDKVIKDTYIDRSGDYE